MDEVFVTYVDFELKIGPGRGREYPVTVTHSPAGEAHSTMRFPYDESALEKRLVVLQNAFLGSGGGPTSQSTLPEELVLRSFGRDLFGALFSGEVGHCYEQSTEEAWQENKRVRLKLRFQSSDMAALPWEFLYDPRQAEYTCLSHNTPLVRYLDPPRTIPPLSLTPPLRILGVIARPGDEKPQEVAHEREWMETALQGLQVRGLVELTWLEGQSWHHVQEAMGRGDRHVFHFFGQGDSWRREAGGDRRVQEGETRPLGVADLARPLADHPSLGVAVLSARERVPEGQPHGTASLRNAFTSTATLLVRQGIPAVLAIPYEITDEAAIELFRVFYEALALGTPIDATVAEARKAVSTAVSDTLEWGAPALFTSSPDGLVFSHAMGLDFVPEQVMEEPSQAPVPLETPEDVLVETLDDVPLETPEEVQEPEPAPVITVQEAEEPPREPEPEPEPPVRTPQPLEPELVLIPAGEFLMGSDPEKDPRAYEAEQPQHSVYLPDYHIARTPVTNAQYAAFVEASRYEAPNHWVDGKLPDDKEDYPVVYISWRDATAYCKWLSKKKGQAYRLPSEAEWEKAARGTDGGVYPWGDAWDQDHCNSKKGGPDDATLVDAYPDGASPYGILDMAGNVWEWTGSLYRPYPYDPVDGREDPRAGGKRVLRGGAFYSTARRVRCAYRDNGYPDNWRGNYGFRVCVSSG